MNSSSSTENVLLTPVRYRVAYLDNGEHEMSRVEEHAPLQLDRKTRGNSPRRCLSPPSRPPLLPPKRMLCCSRQVFFSPLLK